MTYCSGEHKCILCGVVFKCEGVGYGHDNSKESQCHGPYEQFCTNHPISEYYKWHKDHGEI